MDDNIENFVWQAPEFKHNYKDIAWYGISIATAFFLFIAAIWQKNLLFGIFVIIAEIMLLFWAKQRPKDIHFKIDKKGVYIGEMKFYSYEELAGFHLIEGEGDEMGELILKTKNRLHPHVKILIENGNIPRIKNILKDHISEIEYEESLSDSISKFIGF